MHTTLYAALTVSPNDFVGGIVCVSLILHHMTIRLRGDDGVILCIRLCVLH